MSSESSSASAAPGPGTLPRKMPMQGAVNALMRGMLHTPGIANGIGSKIIVLYFTGRKTGRKFSLPVAYTRHGDSLVMGTPFGWARNLRTGEPIEVLYKGRRRPADVEVFQDETGVVTHYDILCRDRREFAKFVKVGFDAEGNPNPEDLRTAWRNGGRAIRLTLRDR